MSRIFIALIIELILAVPIIYVLEKLREKLLESVVLRWLMDHVGLPFVRVLLILIFILSAYPALYGVEQLPSLASVLFDHTERIHSLINWLFISSLVIPFLPMVGVIPAFVLPIQSILATALLFNWATRDVMYINLFPNLIVLGLFIVLSIVTHKIAKMFAEFVGYSLQHKVDKQDMTQLVYESSLLAFQLPAILVYGFYLGSQLKDISY